MFSALQTRGIKLAGALGFMLIGTLAYAGEHAHQHAADKPAATLNQGKKWETDAALRQGMDNLRQAMASKQLAIEKEKLKAADYQQLADAADKNISYIVKNCKLSQDADEAFHSIVLAELIQNVEMMRKAPKVQMQRVGALGVLQSLRHYGEYFQHPGWQPGVANPG